MKRLSEIVLVLGLQCVACVAPPGAAPVQPVHPPAVAGALAPRLSVHDTEALLTWLERRDEGHRLQFARLDGELWSEPATVVEGDDFFANWADCPAVVSGDDGSLLAHRLYRIGPATYDYGIQLFYRPASGEGWRATGDLQDSATRAEYGFVSSVPTGGGVRAFWLDGRAMPEGGGMQLRTTVVLEGVAGRSTVLDERVCECCQTDAASTSEGPVVVYRDRSSEEVRDISVVRWSDGGWSEPAPVHADGWRIPGCPVNGPAVAASGREVAVAWFTAAGDRPRVLLARSSDAGRSFSPPLVVDADAPIGRVDVALEEGGAGAWVSWIGTAGPSPAVLLRRYGREEGPGPVVSVTPTSSERAAGFPRLALHAGRLLVVWVEQHGEESRLRAAIVGAG